MKRTLIVSLALICSASSVMAQPFSKERMLATTCIAATGPLVFCMYKAIRGSKTAKTILKGAAATALTAGAVASAFICTDSRAVEEGALILLPAACICGLGACLFGNAVANDLNFYHVDLNKTK